MSPLLAMSDTIRFCPLCSKPIATESAYKRHVSYCRRTQDRPRKRPRSCKECHSAKAKCSFESQCSRCRSKGLACVYEKPSVPAASTGATTTTTAANLTNQGTSTYDDASGCSDNDNIYAIAICNASPACSPLNYRFGSCGSLDLPPTSPRSAADVRADPIARHSAQFVLESLRALPLAMLSRETFSWYCHGYWYQPELPRNIATCSQLVNLYIKPHSSIGDSFQPVFDNENRRLLHDLPASTFDEVVSSMHVLIIYMIMFPICNRTIEEVPEVSLQTLMTFDLYGVKSSQLNKRTWFPLDELDDPGLTWKDWVFAETRRRTAATWFLLSRVMDLKFGARCPSIVNYRSLLLPSPESLWNARTQSDWEAARNIYLQRRGKWLRTFGDLIDARSAPPNSELFHELNRWHASCDKLGLLLTLATAMV